MTCPSWAQARHGGSSSCCRCEVGLFRRGTSGRMSAGWCEQVDAAGMLLRSTDTMRPDPVYGAVAQLVAHLHGMEGVRGSNPLSSTNQKVFTFRQCPYSHLAL